MIKAYKHLCRLLVTGEITEEYLTRVNASFHGLTLHSDSNGLKGTLNDIFKDTISVGLNMEVHDNMLPFTFNKPDEEYKKISA
jgi:hypothetical protein